jgi:signal peptidase I
MRLKKINKRIHPVLGAVKRFFKIILFAALSGLICKVLFIQYYSIPSQSMANTLTRGEAVLVNKFGYGTNIFNLRLPGFLCLKRNDIAVFTDPSKNNALLIKRAVGLPGDTIIMLHTAVYVNGLFVKNPETSINNYYVKTEDSLKLSDLKSRFNFVDYYQQGNVAITVPLTPAVAARLRHETGLTTFHVEQMPGPQADIYPTKLSKWTNDNYGPIIVPRKELILPLNESNYFLYKKVIEDYEGNTSGIINKKVYINGKFANSYIFKKNYYFMLGDNRNHSKDSRYWGFLPDDFIVGKAVLKFSLNKKHSSYLSVSKL